jgi:hypothetical protein
VGREFEQVVEFTLRRLLDREFAGYHANLRRNVEAAG